MMAYKMTAKRRAALRKAQLASARKRRKGGRAKSTYRAVKRSNAAKRSYARKHYKGRGGISRQASDMYHSRGAYSRNWRGRKYGKTAKRVNKVATVAVFGHPTNAAMLAGSKFRGRKRKRR
ncbi:gp13 [Mycobacterium phage Barnyard]|uniref:Uncharacterized protein n=1 Tax=Mycobacterium phage Barnyard TaxID=205880 RepID=Q856F9_9CAUD|nr:gp13 [Mycobacterium phage Barnyard]AAN02067.1 hypothetical protein PBI_BARNYARD_13 [Mycobacterium phage Barnyard]